MLKKYHVVVFGRRATSKHLIFSVKTAQAEYAEYLLLRYGAKVVSRFNPKNAGWASKHNGVIPTPWDSKKKNEQCRKGSCYCGCYCNPSHGGWDFCLPLNRSHDPSY